MTIEEAAKAMYAAFDALQAFKGSRVPTYNSDAYGEARMRYSNARDAYDAAYAARTTEYLGKIRNDGKV